MKHLLLLLFASASDALFGSLTPFLDECAGRCMFASSCWLISGKVSGAAAGGRCFSPFDVCCLRNEAEVESEQRMLDKVKMQDLERKYEEEGDGGGFNDLQATATKQGKIKKIEFGPVWNEPGCGRLKIAKRRVVGGEDAGFGQFPWQALVYANRDRCGGALINRRHVVTAGHCVFSKKRAEDGSTVPAHQIRVLLGEYAIGEDSEPLGRVEYGVDSVRLHPQYGWREQADRFDVAVLRLTRPVQFKPHIQPVCLPAAGEAAPAGTVAAVAGWGALRPRGKRRPATLQAVEVEVVDSKKCEKWHYDFARIRVSIDREMMCAGYKMGGRDACQGDSGGPLVADMAQIPSNSTTNSTETTPEQKWTLIGLVSAGFSCAQPGRPGIYHRVSETAGWISYASRMGSRTLF